MKNVIARLGLVVMMALAFGVLAFSNSASAQSNSMTVTMNAQNGSGESGTATITDKGGSAVTVMVNLSNGTSVAQPAHIHKGSCANLDPNPAYPLTNVTNGTSTTDVMVSMADLEKGGYAINVHKSATEATTYVSCGDIAMMMTSGGTSMPNTGAGDQPMMLALLAVVALAVTGAGLKLSHSPKR